jgi:YbbR domain-containing protein
MMMMRLATGGPSFKCIYRKIEPFLSRFQWKEVLIFLFFLFLSFIFWLLLNMQNEYEIQLEIPVGYKNMPKDMAFEQTPPSAIKVRIRDKGSVLLNYTLGQQKASIAVDIQHTSGEHHRSLLLSASDIESMLMKQLVPSTALLSFDPQQIEIPYSKLKKKRLPVHFDGKVHTEPGFAVSGDITVTPSAVDVFAGEAVLESLRSVSTVYTEIDGGNKRIIRKLKLRDMEGATFDPPVVSVEIPIEEYTEKTLDIPVVCKNVPPGYAIRLFPSVVRVTCNVPLSIFKELSEKDFSAEVSAGNPEQIVSGMLPVRFARKPDRIDKVSLSPDSVEFILEQIK